MNLGVLLIVVGILLALFLHWSLGVLCIIVGAVLLVVPRL